MTSKTIIITGASDGIGASAARQLATGGHRLLLVGRSAEKLAPVAAETGGQAFTADFTRLDEVRRLASELTDALAGEQIDVLANNAGGIYGDPQRTPDGFEKTLQVNHLAPFLLTNLLMPHLQHEGAAVVATSSVGHRLFGKIDLDDLNNDMTPTANKTYGDAKLANVLFTKSLHTRYADTGLSAVAFHPGNVRTNFAADTTSFMRFVYQSPLKRLSLVPTDKGGATLAWFITGTPGSTWTSGEYYDGRTLTTKVNPQVNDVTLAEGLWQRSAEMVGL